VNSINLNEKKYIDYYFIILFSVLPISIIVGSSISLLNILIIDFSFIVYLFIKKDFSFLTNSTFKILIFFYIYLIFNSLVSLEPSYGIYRNLGFIRVIILFICINYFFLKKEFFNKVFLFWFLILLIVTFDIFYESYFGKNILDFASRGSGGGRIVSFFKDELIVGSYLATFLFIIFGKFYSQKKFTLSLILFSIISLAIFLTGERSIVIKIFFSYLIIFFFVFKNSKLKIFILAFLFFIILIISANKNLNDRYTKSFSEISTSMKNPNMYESILNINYLNQLIFSYEILKKNYLFGVGTKNYFKACTDLKNTSKNEHIRKNTHKCFVHPHQFYYEFISEHGIIGTVIILICIFMLFSINRTIELNNQKKSQLLIFKIYIIISLIPIIPTGTFFSSLNLFQFFLNYSFYQIYFSKK